MSSIVFLVSLRPRSDHRDYSLLTAPLAGSARVPNVMECAILCSTVQYVISGLSCNCSEVTVIIPVYTVWLVR